MRISVIIPVYNGAALVGEAIESALSQGVGSTEIITVDDGSTDSTRQVLDSYQPHITVLQRANGGLCAARNTAVALSLGEYIALLDADDVWRPGRLRCTVDALERNPKSVMAFCDYVPMDPSGKLLQPTRATRAPTHADLLNGGWSIVPSAATIRRSALERVGLFCESFKGCAGGEDHYMWLRLSELGSFEHVAEPLVIHRLTSAAATIQKYEAGRKVFARLVKQRYGPPGSAIIKDGKHFFAGILLAGAAKELAAGNLQATLWMLALAVRYRPLVFFSPIVSKRLLTLQNLRLLAKAVLATPSSDTRHILL